MDKAARKLFAQAERAQQGRKREQRVRRDHEQSGQQFCAGCYAVLQDGRCPSCDLGRATWQKFCRTCLCVHESRGVVCRPWTPRST